MTITIDDYINRVLAAMPAATPQRSQIAMELRGHIAERMQGGQSADDVFRQLGDPVRLAESYLSAVPLVSASFGARAIAKVLDIALVIVFMGAVAGTLAGLFSQFLPLEAVLPFTGLIALVGGAFVFGIYTIVAEYLAGETLGKRAMRLRVVRESGARISLGQAIVRQLPMFVQVYIIDALFALFTEKRQRAFELLSKTRVVTARQE
jgi:uncharacterized RDD family membrane protein YckC